MKKGSAQIKILPFDSEVFGFPCGELEIENDLVGHNALSILLKDAIEAGLRHLCVKIPSLWINCANLLEDLGFRLKICSLELSKKIKENSKPDTSLLVEEIISISDYEQKRLISITQSAFSNHTRFHYEDAFHLDLVSKLYTNWIINSIKDQSIKVFVHRINNVITGYITVRIDSAQRIGCIDLFAVDFESRNRGIGKRIIQMAEYSLQNQLNQILVRTESINYSALNCYIKSSYKIIKSLNVFHVYLPVLDISIQ